MENIWKYLIKNIMWSTFCTGSALADPLSVFKGSGFSGLIEKGTHDSDWGPSADRYQIQPLFLQAGVSEDQGKRVFDGNKTNKRENMQA